MTGYKLRDGTLTASKRGKFDTFDGICTPETSRHISFHYCRYSQVCILYNITQSPSVPNSYLIPRVHPIFSSHIPAIAPPTLPPGSTTPTPSPTIHPRSLPLSRSGISLVMSRSTTTTPTIYPRSWFFLIMPRSLSPSFERTIIRQIDVFFRLDVLSSVDFFFSARGYA